MSQPVTTAPVELYRDPAVYARERASIFAKAWLFMGLEADLIRPGDYIAETLAEFPLLVVKDSVGGLRGFHNVCRHRAGPLVGEAKGRCDHEFTCRYHGWRYDFDGRLKAATGFGPVDGFDTGDHGLFPIRVETWRGFVFVNLDLESAPLSETLAPLDARFGKRPELSARMRHSHPVACNWKIYVENYLEGYHLEGVHPGLAIHLDADLHEVRVEGLVALHEAPPRSETTEGFWAWVWPNLGFSLYRDVLLIEHMRPSGPGRTQLDHIYLHQPEDPSIDAATLTSERITEEDAWICQRVQENLNAGVYDHGPLSPAHEGAVAWFQNAVARALAG